MSADARNQVELTAVLWAATEALDSAWRAFSASGRPERLDQFDWQAGKGVGLARVLLPGAAQGRGA